MNNKFVKLNKNIILKIDDILFAYTNYLVARFNINDKKEYKINKKEFINIYVNIIKNKNFITFNNILINTKYLFMCQLIKNEIYLEFKRYKNGIFEQRFTLPSKSQAQTLFNLLNNKIE